MSKKNTRKYTWIDYVRDARTSLDKLTKAREDDRQRIDFVKTDLEKDYFRRRFMMYDAEISRINVYLGELEKKYGVSTNV